MNSSLNVINNFTVNDIRCIRTCACETNVIQTLEALTKQAEHLETKYEPLSKRTEVHWE